MITNGVFFLVLFILITQLGCGNGGQIEVNKNSASNNFIETSKNPVVEVKSYQTGDLIFASYHNDVEEVKRLLKDPEADVNESISYESLQKIEKSFNNSKTLASESKNELLSDESQNGKNSSSSKTIYTKEFITPLIVALIQKNKIIADELIAHGANVDEIFSQEVTCLQVYSYLDQFDMWSNY